VIEALLLQDLVYGTVCLLVCVRSIAIRTILAISAKLIYSGIEKSQRSVTYDFVRYINTLTYLLTYIQCTHVTSDVVQIQELQGT